ncbi:ABC transporter permease [Arthrobacter castelli]|uniref:ABC transporter permease n=1 Tax=Arthrobacter castelli TaxID=271431 RepID=UPI00047AD91E|nr:hypothetical protein [Arthrobacter castelli]
MMGTPAAVQTRPRHRQDVPAATGTGTAGQYRRLVALVLRRHWTQLLAWLIPLLALVAVTAPSYAELYPDLAQRTVLVESLRANTATAVLYGPLPDPGTLGQLLVWETGTYVLIVGAVMALLLAVTLVRRPEDAGTLAVVRSTGTAPWLPVAASFTVLIGQCLALGAGTALILWGQAQVNQELTTAGAFTFGAVVAAVSGAFALLATVMCQLAPDGPVARSWSLLILGIAFLARAVPNAGATLDDAGAAPVTWLHWVSPLGWVQVVAPYTRDRAWPFWVFGAVLLLLLVLSLWLASKREYQAGIIARRRGHDRGLRVSSGFGLARRRGMGSAIGWTVAVVALGALFGGMSSGLLDLLTGSDVTAQLVRRMMGDASVTSMYFQMVTLIAGIFVAVYAVGSVMRVRADESAGLLEAELVTGRRRWEPLVAAWVAAVVGSAVMLLLAGLVTAGITAQELGGQADAGRIIGYFLLQWPAAVCLAGATALLIGLRPQLAWIGWALVAVTASMTWFGSLLEPPGWLMDLMVFNHVPDLAGDDPVYWPLAVLAGIGVAAVLLAVPSMQRRDIRR